MKGSITIEENLEIVKNRRVFLTSQEIILLKLVKKKGSNYSAFKTLKMFYQQAWHSIQDMNKIWPLPLVIRQSGDLN